MGDGVLGSMVSQTLQFLYLQRPPSPSTALAPLLSVQSPAVTSCPVSSPSTDEDSAGDEESKSQNGPHFAPKHPGFESPRKITTKISHIVREGMQ